MQLRKYWIWPIGAACVIAVMTVTVHLTDSNKRPVTTAVSAVKLDQVRKWFGPWKLVSPGGEPTSQLIIVTRTAKLQLGVKRVPVSMRWQPDSFFRKGQHMAYSWPDDIKVSLPGGKFVYLPSGQPFVLYDQPNRVYVQTNNELFSLDTTTARRPAK